MLKKLIGVLLVWAIVLSAVTIPAAAAGESTVTYEMNTVNDVNLVLASGDKPASRAKELVSGKYGRSADDYSMSVGLNTDNSSRPAKENNRGIATIDINQKIPVGGMIESSFYMASDFALGTNLSIMAYNSNDEEVSLGNVTGSCAVGRTLCWDKNMAKFVVFRDLTASDAFYYSDATKAHFEKNRWYRYTIRITRVAEKNITFELYVDNRLFVKIANMVPSRINSSLDEFCGISSLWFGYSFWDADLNQGVKSIYLDDVKSVAYSNAADAPALSGAVLSNTGLNFYTPAAADKLNGIPYSFSTAMFVRKDTKISDVKDGFTINGKDWAASGAVVRNADGDEVTDETEPILGNYLSCTDDAGNKYYINPIGEGIMYTMQETVSKNDKGVLYRKEDNVSAHGRDGLTLLDQFLTRNEYIEQNNLDDAAATELKQYLLDNGLVYNTDKQSVNPACFPVTVEGDFLLDLTGKTCLEINVKFVDTAGNNVFFTPRAIVKSDRTMGDYTPFYSAAWNKIAVTIYPGTKRADMYLNGVFVGSFEATAEIAKILTVKVLLTTTKNNNGSKGKCYIDNLSVKAGIYEPPAVTAKDIVCEAGVSAQVDNDTNTVKLSKPITKAELQQAVANLASFDGYGLYTKRALTEITEDDYVITQNDSLMVRKDGIWKYYDVIYEIPFALGKLSMIQNEAEIYDGHFVPGQIDISMPVVNASSPTELSAIIACYNQNRLVRISVAPPSQIETGGIVTGSAVIPEEADVVTIMLWDNTVSANPMMSCVKLDKREQVSDL